MSIYVLNECCVKVGRKISPKFEDEDEDWDNTIIQAAKEKSASLESFKEDEIHIFKTPPNLMKGRNATKISILVEKLRAQLLGLPTSNADELFIELQDETFEEFFPTDEKEPCIFLLPRRHGRPVIVRKTFSDEESEGIRLHVRVAKNNYGVDTKRSAFVFSIVTTLKEKYKDLLPYKVSDYRLFLFTPEISQAEEDPEIDGADKVPISRPKVSISDIFAFPPRPEHISLAIFHKTEESCEYGICLR